MLFADIFFEVEEHGAAVGWLGDEFPVTNTRGVFLARTPEELLMRTAARLAGEIGQQVYAIEGLVLRHFDAFQISMRWSKEIIIPVSALLRILGHNFSRTIVDFWPELEAPLSFAVMGLAVALILAALVYLARRAPRSTAPLALLLVVFPIGMLLVPDLLFGGIRSISMRYLTPAWVGVLLALGYFLGTISPPRLGAGLGALVLLISLLSTAHNAPEVAVWTKATSVSLPQVAAAVNRTENALIVGNFERHNPGNLMALSTLLRPGTKMQFLDVKKEERWVLPRNFSAVYLLSPIPDYMQAMERREGVRAEKLVEDHFLDLWEIHTSTAARSGSALHGEQPNGRDG